MNRWAVSVALTLATMVGCGPESGSGDQGGSGSGQATDDSSTGSLASPSSGSSTSAAVTTTEGLDSATSTGAACPTAQECFALDSQDACIDAGCSRWSNGSVVTGSTDDSCMCGPESGVCLLFDDLVGAGSFPRSWVPEFQPDLVLELSNGWTTYPVGFTPCEEVVDPPAACACFDGAADHCDSQPGTTD